MTTIRSTGTYPLIIGPQPHADDGLTPGQLVEFVAIGDQDGYGLIERIGQDPDAADDVALPGDRGTWLGTLPTVTFGYPPIHVIEVGERYAPVERGHFVTVTEMPPAGWQMVYSHDRSKVIYWRRQVTDRVWLTVQERAPGRFEWRWAPLGILAGQGAAPSLYQAMQAADAALAHQSHRYVSHNRADGSWCRWSYVNTSGRTRICPDRCPDSDVELDPTPEYESDASPRIQDAHPGDSP